ncbi:MAG: NAD(P)H-binding protein [Pseudomonadota bacterium]
MRVLLVGATGALGLRIARRLRAAGHDVRATWRAEAPEALAELSALGCETAQLDLEDVGAAAPLAEGCEAAVFTPILTVSGPAARALPTSARLVLFSSNNVTVDPDAPVYAALRAEEAALAASGHDHILLRPTMIYGHVGDGNLARLIRLAQRSPVLPIAGSGRALQQPIHIDDLANLAAKLAGEAFAGGATYSPAGPDTLTLGELYRAVRGAAGARALILRAPPQLLAAASSLIGWVPGLKAPLSAAQLARIERDKTPPPGSAPPGWSAKVSLEQGLRDLAKTLG